MLSDTGKPTSFIVPIDYQKNPEIRIVQYKTKKSFRIAKAIVEKKLKNQLDFLEFFECPTVLMKSNLLRIEEAETIRKLLTIEAKWSSIYFPYYFDFLEKKTDKGEKGCKGSSK